MPWEHCDATISDVDPCPSCGITKEQWTLEFNVTRTFQVRRRTTIQLALLDAADEGVAGEPYEVELEDGRLLTGELDDEGKARIEGGTGSYLVSFPLRHADEVVPYPLDESSDQEAGEGSGGEAAEHEAATFERAGNRRHRFQLADDCLCDDEEDADEGAAEELRDLRLSLADLDGEPVPGEPYQVTWRDGHVDEGRLDDAGSAVVPGRPGVALLRFPYRSPHEVHPQSEHAHERYVPIADDEEDHEPAAAPEPTDVDEASDPEPTDGTGDEPLDDEDDDELTAGFDCAHSEEAHSFQLDQDQCLADPEDDDEEPGEFHCEEAGRVVVHQELQDAIAAARRLAGETLPVTGGVCPTPPELCPADLRDLHASGDAVHITELDGSAPGLVIRIAELAGLWGLDLSGETHHNAHRRQLRKAIHVGAGGVSSDIYPLGIKSLSSSAPWADLSVVALREGTTRHIHLHRGGERRVEARVDGERWRSLPISAHTGPYEFGYTLHKTSWWMASYHRQWGREHSIAWLLGLRSFYQHVIGRPLGIGDVSHIVGEDQTDHHSHEQGVDVDLYPLDILDTAPGVYSEAYWCQGPTSGELQLSRLRPPAEQPSAEHPLPRYHPNHGGGRITDADERRAVLRGYATILAYCMVTRAQIELVIWQGINNPELHELAGDIARAGFKGEGGWREEWGRVNPWTGDANPWVATAEEQIALPARGRRLGPDRQGNHEDHVHIRLFDTPRTA